MIRSLQTWTAGLRQAGRRPAPIRPARTQDRAALRALLAPAVASGAILPTEPDTDRFLVAEGRGGLVGAVALTPWAPEVAELGSLVSAQPGCGLGGRLVQAALAQAASDGFSTVVALTGLGDWFARQGFVPVAVPPWALAQGYVSQTPALPGLTNKAERSCQVCPRLAVCQQSLLARGVAAPGLQVAA